MVESRENSSNNFIKTIIKEDLASGKVKEVITRFPPEPNGYLHIGHAKAICLNFGLADEFGGRTNLRFDDTNPVKEDMEFVDGILNDIKWLGFDWEELHFASDYFENNYHQALHLIRKGRAYVDDQTADEIRENRGTLTKPGKESPYRDRSAQENLDLFQRMRAGEFKDGEKVLRAKIDMGSPNITLRDPVLYRIKHAHHHQTGDAWCIYPMYAFSHPLGDAIEGVSHSLCSMEYEEQRPLYDWVVSECDMEKVPHQYEFARLNLTNTVMSKRKLKLLVDSGVVDGWDDPRMPTVAGLRRKGLTPEAIRTFCREIGVAKSNSVVDERLLEHFIREDLKLKAPRTMAVIDPLKVVITNYPEGQVEWLEAENNMENPDMGSRQIPFSREIYIEWDDFMEEPPAKYFRLFPGNEVRLKNAYFIKCEEVVKDEEGKVIELRCTYDPETKSGTGFTGRKVKGTIHWVEATHAVPAEFRLYEPILLDEQGDTEADNDVPEEEEDYLPEAGAEEAGGTADVKPAAGQSKIDRSFLEQLNPNSLTVFHGFVEPNMKESKPHDKYQFFRHGYFNVDPKDTADDHLVINRIVSLKSSFVVK